MGIPRDDAVSDEAALVDRCLRQDEQAVVALIERYQTDVFGLCMRLLDHRQDAEDTCQEVFVRVFRSLRRWDRKRPLRPWILGITVNRCRTLMSQRSRRPELADYLHDTAEARPQDEPSELMMELSEAVAALRPDFRAVFVMFHERNVPYEEIAEALDRPVGTIKTWLHRARTAVLTRLKERGMVPDSLLTPE